MTIQIESTELKLHNINKQRNTKPAKKKGKNFWKSLRKLVLSNPKIHSHNKLLLVSTCYRLNTIEMNRIKFETFNFLQDTLIQECIIELINTLMLTKYLPSATTLKFIGSS